eukprot:g20546.t1
MLDLATLKVTKLLPPTKAVTDLLEFQGHIIVAYSEGMIKIFDAEGNQKRSTVCYARGTMGYFSSGLRMAACSYGKELKGFEEESKKDEQTESSEADFSAMNFFSADAAAQLEEARKLGGLLRLQWHLAVVKASQSKSRDKGERDKGEKGDDKEKDQSHRSIPLGVGFSTEEPLAKARALRAAEVRAEVLTEAMFLKPNQKEKN